MTLRVVTWNINSVRLRIASVLRVVQELRPDILCLQEIKCETGKFPTEALRNAGLIHQAVNGQPGYHGVAVLSRQPIEIIETADLNDTGEARHMAVLVRSKGARSGIEIHNFYVPSGGDLPDMKKNPKFRQKIHYLQGLEGWSRKTLASRKRPAVLVGDLNVAPLEHDVWSHKQMLDVVSHTPVEVEHLDGVMSAHGWQDIMRRFVPPSDKLYTWWSYRAVDWQISNRGRRLDHVWTSPQLAEAATSMHVFKDARGWEKPSDHVPVAVDFDLA